MRRGVPGRRVVVGFVLFLAIAIGGAISLWYMRKDPHGPVISSVALGQDSILLRQGYEERGYIHLMRVDPEGNTRWSEALYGIEPDPALTVAGGHVLVRAREARGHAELHVFDLEGNFAWRSGRNRYESPEGNPAFCEHPLWVTERDVFYVHASTPREVIVLDLQSGEERARVELPAGEGARGAELAGAALSIDTGDGVRRIVESSGGVEVQ